MTEFMAWVDVIDVSCLSNYKPDLKWRYRDKKRHVHFWKKDKLPTLMWIIDAPADDEYPEIGHYECVKCGQPVQPRYLPLSPYREYMIGSRHVSIDGIEVTREEFARELAKEKR